MKRRWQVIAVLVVLALVWASGAALVPPVAEKPRSAVSRAEQILRACEAYRDHPQNPERGKYPTELAELLAPSFGGPPFLRNGQGDLYDPWGNQFEYSVVGNGTAEAEVRVWTVCGEVGKRQVIGAKRRANGEIEVLGLEE